MAKELSEKDYWNEKLSKIPLPRIYSVKQYNIYRFNSLFKDLLKDKSNCRIIEIGCGSSAWLPYFYKEYGLDVYGIDYSQIGCEIAEKNLEYFINIRKKRIWQMDLFSIDTTKTGFYDIVFSYGVIEHFDDPRIAIDSISKLLKPGGIIITVVPNFLGIFGLIQRIFMNDIYKIHKLINKNEIINYHTQYIPKYSNFFGTFYLEVVPWVNIKIKNIILKKILLKFVYLFSQFMSLILKNFHIKFESKYFSPYIVYVGEKI